jgi:hypothetical protein
VSINLWRYEAPPGVWHYVTSDPAAIKRPGEKLHVFTQTEFEDFVRSMTEDTMLCRTQVKR